MTFLFCQLFILYLGILILLDSTASPCSGILLIGHVNIVIIIIIIIIIIIMRTLFITHMIK
jgi:hypothetical protein